MSFPHHKYCQLGLLRPLGVCLFALCATPAASAAQFGFAGTDGYAIGDFPRALISNSFGLATSDNLTPFLLGTGLVLVAHQLDDNAKSALNGEADLVGNVGDALGKEQVSLGGIAALFIAGQIAPTGRFREVTFDLAQGMLINGGITGFLKYTVGRQRPDSTNFMSFPSGHTSASFTTATILARQLGPRVGIPALLVATFIGVSRVEDNAHFLSDVVAGATIGYIAGRTVTSGPRHDRNTARARLSVAPFPSPGGAGVLVSLSF